MESFDDRPATRRYQFGLRDLLIVVTVIGLLLMLLMPAIEAARETARRTRCISNMKQLGIALYNYHDRWRQFPNVSTSQIRGVTPASSGTDSALAAGYSWQVAILPFNCWVTATGEEMNASIKRLERGPFDPAEVRGAESAPSSSINLPACVIGDFQCPSYSGPRFSDAPEYVQTAGPNGIAISNYTALSATQLDCILGDPQSAGHTTPNGVIVPGPTKVTRNDVTDGTSKTIFLCETREPGYASWIDGTVGWAVGADCNQPAPTVDASGYLRTPHGIALNVGPRNAKPQTSYLPARLHKSIAADWRWGPSSQHSGGVVVHGIADASASAITDDIDPTLYLQLITRQGREPMYIGD